MDGTCHFAGIAINSSHQNMVVDAAWGAIINVLHDDCFAFGVVTSQGQHHIQGIMNLPISAATSQGYSRKHKILEEKKRKGGKEGSSLKEHLSECCLAVTGAGIGSRVGKWGVRIHNVRKHTRMIKSMLAQGLYLNSGPYSVLQRHPSMPHLPLSLPWWIVGTVSFFFTQIYV